MPVSFVISLLLVPSLCIQVSFVSTSQNAAPSASAQDFAALKSEAETGNSYAQLKLALAYDHGEGVAQDDRMAAFWYLKAADQGNAEAQDALGTKFLVGQGVQRDKTEAVSWFRKSAHQGNANAMYHLGAAYYNGDGVEVDDSLSYAWFSAAKEAGHPNASEAVQRAESTLKPSALTVGLEDIGEMYEPGGALPTNDAAAEHWWSLAAARGDEDAQAALAFKTLKSSSNLQEQKKARHLCENAARNHEHRAEYCMGYIYQNGLGVSRDPKKARNWYSLAAKGDGRAIRALASMEQSGEGGKVDRVEAFILFARLAVNGDQDAIQSLARLKTKISPREWDSLRTPLIRLHIDPTKLEVVLEQVNTH